jgi:hypothetical protein
MTYQLKSISYHFSPCRAETGLARWLLCQPSPKLRSATHPFTLTLSFAVVQNSGWSPHAQNSCSSRLISVDSTSLKIFLFVNLFFGTPAKSPATPWSACTEFTSCAVRSIARRTKRPSFLRRTSWSLQPNETANRCNGGRGGSNERIVPKSSQYLAAWDTSLPKTFPH